MEQAGHRLGLYVFRVLRTPLEPGASQEARPGLVVRLAPESELAACATDPALELSAPRIREAFRRGDVCVGAFLEGKLVGYVWFAYRTAQHVKGVWVDFPDEAIYRYKSFVRPEHRGKRIAALLYHRADEIFERAGRRYVLLCIETHNYASIAAATRGGATPLGWFAYWQAGRRLFALCSRGVERAGLRFFIPRAAA
jgi:GNAT superfamily N-acetyltransferase